MALNKYAIKVPGGDINKYCQSYTAGGTFARMDVVKFSSGTIVIAAENDVAALGWAMTAGSNTATCIVLKAFPDVMVVMPTTGTEAVTNVGVRYELHGTTGAQTVNVDESTNDLLLCHEIDTTNALGLFSIPADLSQATKGA